MSRWIREHFIGLISAFMGVLSAGGLISLWEELQETYSEHALVLVLCCIVSMAVGVMVGGAELFVKIRLEARKERIQEEAKRKEEEAQRKEEEAQRKKEEEALRKAEEEKQHKKEQDDCHWFRFEVDLAVKYYLYCLIQDGPIELADYEWNEACARTNIDFFCEAEQVGNNTVLITIENYWKSLLERNPELLEHARKAFEEKPDKEV